MARKRKPARLYFRADEEQWVIRDGTVQRRTGFGEGQRGEAEKALATYLSAKTLPERSGPAHPGELSVGEVLARYAEDKGTGMQAPATLAYSIAALAPFWGDLTCDAVKGSTCRRYAKLRDRASGTIRRELGVLQSALNHAHAEGLLVHPLRVELPSSGSVRERWLTRDEAARLLLYAAPHVRRFIVLSLYTGRRAGALLDLTWTRVDTEAGFIRFREAGERETNKRRGKARMPRQLCLHMTRWYERHESLPASVQGRDTHVIMFRGARVGSIKTGIHRAAERAGLDAVTPHVLKHTALTWAVSSGHADVEEWAEYFDTSPETIRRHYWHHSPHHQARAIEAIERRGR